MIMKHWRKVAGIGLANLYLSIIFFILNFVIAGYICLSVYVLANIVVIVHFKRLMDKELK